MAKFKIQIVMRLCLVPCTFDSREIWEFLNASCDTFDSREVGGSSKVPSSAFDSREKGRFLKVPYGTFDSIEIGDRDIVWEDFIFCWVQQLSCACYFTFFCNHTFPFLFWIVGALFI